MRADEPLVELETDKVTVEVPAPQARACSPKSASRPARTIAVGGVLGTIGEGAGAAAAPPKPQPLPKRRRRRPARAAAQRPRRSRRRARSRRSAVLSPSARKIAEENNVTAAIDRRPPAATAA